MCDFGLIIFIFEGKIYVEDIVIGIVGYLVFDYYISFMLMEKIDVYLFGVLFFVFLIGWNVIMRLGIEEEIL